MEISECIVPDTPRALHKSKVVRAGRGEESNLEQDRSPPTHPTVLLLNMAPRLPRNTPRLLSSQKKVHKHCLHA